MFKTLLLMLNFFSLSLYADSTHFSTSLAPDCKLSSHLMHVPEMQVNVKPKQSTTVAVIDTGLDLTNTQLQKVKITQPWNFINSSTEVSDFHGHGTHVAGIIFSIADAAVTIMPLKWFDVSISGVSAALNFRLSIKYAIEHNVQVINYSGGGWFPSVEEYAIIKKANDAGIIFVTAAGNDGRNIDFGDVKFYPAAYDLPNIISVASITSNGTLAKSSNFGPKNVDVAARGDQISSFYLNGTCAYISGTSQATAFVSGVIASLLSENPKLKPEQVKQILINSSDKNANLTHKVLSGGNINAFEAFKLMRKLSLHKEKGML